MPPPNLKSELDSEIGRSRRNWLEMPAIGMESEFNVWLDEVDFPAQWDPKLGIHVT